LIIFLSLRHYLILPPPISPRAFAMLTPILFSLFTPFHYAIAAYYAYGCYAFFAFASIDTLFYFIEMLPPSLRRRHHAFARYLMLFEPRCHLMPSLRCLPFSRRR